MNIADLPDDSDTSDDDYVPERATAELPSEEESDGDAEDALPDQEDLGKRGTKRQKKVGKSKKKRKTAIEEAPKEREVTEKEKQKTEDLWADFIKDTGFKTKAERQHTSNETSNKETDDIVTTEPKVIESAKVEPQKMVKITQVFKFAGEEVKIEKEVSADSAEVRLSNTPSGSEISRKSGSGGRLNTILNQLGKKPKINTLEKSKLDWEQFKKDEDIADELKAYSKSKDGYLERQDFLERADLRRFEIEKEIRTNLRSNRMNNVNM